MNFTNAHSHHLILTGEEDSLYLAVSKLITCLIAVMPQKQSHCNISSCFGENFNILPADINRTLLTKSQRYHTWDVIQAWVPNLVLTFKNTACAQLI